MKADAYERICGQQNAICARYGSEFVPAGLSSKLGISKEALTEALPIHGLRHPPSGGASGWYIWSGNYSEDADFFEPMHVDHALEEPMIFAPYLGLAPGWRFLIGEDGYVDVWFDSGLLQRSEGSE